MKIQYKELEKISCSEQQKTIVKNLPFKEESDTEKNEGTAQAKTLLTVLFILKLKVTCLSRQLEELTIVNKHLNQELEIKSQQLLTANTRISMLKTQLQQTENLLKEINDKYKMLEEVFGNHDAEEFKIAILKLKRFEQTVNRNQKGNIIHNDSDESRSIIYLNELLHALKVSNYYNKVFLSNEVQRRRLIESEFKRIENVVETLSATNIKLLCERNWNKTRRKALIFKQEELLRKNASLQEYSDTLRKKYEALLLKKKKKKRQKENEIPEPNKKIISEESVNTNEFENKNIQFQNAKTILGSGNKQLSELDKGIFRIKEILMKNCNEEKEKGTKLEEKIENMTAEISILQEEKKNFEYRLKTSEENYHNLKINFDELAVEHKNLVDFKNEEQRKINERIISLNERLDFLGHRFVKRYQDERSPIINSIISQNDMQPNLNFFSRNKKKEMIMNDSSVNLKFE